MNQHKFGLKNIKTVILINSILLIFVLITACTTNNISDKTIDTDEVIVNHEDENVNDKMNEMSDFFMSSNGMNLLTTAWQFIKAYLSSDSTTMKEYVMEGLEAEAYCTDLFDDIDYINLQWSFSHLRSEEEISLTYILQIKNESLNYLGLNLRKVEDNWKVTSYTLEK